MSFPLGEILFLVFLTFLEAFFVAAEIALVSVRRSRIDQLVEEGRTSARRVRRLIDDPGRFLAVSQLGLTFIGFFASAFAAVSITKSMESLLTGFGMETTLAENLSLLFVTIILALFTIVFAELIPKSIALASPERFALVLSRPIDLLIRLFGPIVSVLNGITRWVARSMGVDMNHEAQISADELRLIVERGGEQGVLEAEEEQMINAVIELGDRRVHEVMVPRVAIAALGVDANLEEAIDLVVDVGHSRIPVYRESIDEVVGILYAKDLLPYLKNDAGPRPALRKLLRPPVLVPESMTIDDLLHELQRRKVHIAIVLDEYGGTAGLVTIEDLLEEIVGEIQDEYDVEEPMVVRLSDHEARVDGRADVDELLELFDLDLKLEDAEEYDTVGGLLYHRVGGVPAPGDSIDVDGLRLTVETTDGRRVGKVLVTRRLESDQAEDGEADGAEEPQSRPARSAAKRAAARGAARPKR
ncbi:MAG TPA: hemolysin family protein [Candidatus Limnocylindrales bacterium]|nr:hemolysin family protein [Candidatus Limnocylindrales bacterium]